MLDQPKGAQKLGVVGLESLYTLDNTGGPNGTRTRVLALRGPRPRPLDDGTVKKKEISEREKKISMRLLLY